MLVGRGRQQRLQVAVVEQGQVHFTVHVLAQVLGKVLLQQRVCLLREVGEERQQTVVGKVVGEYGDPLVQQVLDKVSVQLFLSTRTRIPAARRRRRRSTTGPRAQVIVEEMGKEDLLEQLVGTQEEAGAEEEGKRVGMVGGVVRGGQQVLQESLQITRCHRRVLEGEFLRRANVDIFIQMTRFCGTPTAVDGRGARVDGAGEET